MKCGANNTATGEDDEISDDSDSDEDAATDHLVTFPMPVFMTSLLPSITTAASVTTAIHSHNSQRTWRSVTSFTAVVPAIISQSVEYADTVPADRRPQPCDLLGCYGIPDITSTLVSLDYFQSSGRKPATSWLTRLLSKAMPLRWKVREVCHTVHKLYTKHKACRVLVRRALLCTLLGAYTWSDKSATSDLAVALVSALHLRPGLGDAWIASARGADHHELQIAMLRELVVHSVRLVPCLREVLCAQRDWLAFEEATETLGNRIRAFLYRGQGGIDLGGLACAVSKYTVPMTRGLVPLEVPYTQTLLTTVASTFSKALQAMDVSQVAALVETSTRTLPTASAGTGLMERLEALGASKETLRCVDTASRQCHGIITRTVSAATRRLFQNLLESDIDSYLLLVQELCVIVTQSCVAVHPLPLSHLRRQTEAMVRALPARTDLFTHPTHVGDLLVCTMCGEVKSSVVETLGVRPSLGSCQVVCDTDAGRLMCARAHSQRGTARRAKRRLSQPPSATHTKSHRTLFDTVTQTERCECAPIALIPLAGNVVRAKNVRSKSMLYTMCTECALPMVIRSFPVGRCVNCEETDTKRSKRSCMGCHGNVSSTSGTLRLLYTLLEGVQEFRLCNQCYPLTRGKAGAPPRVLSLSGLRRSRETERIRKLTWSITNPRRFNQ